MDPDSDTVNIANEEFKNIVMQMSTMERERKVNVMHSLNHWLRPECIVKFSTRVSIVGFNNNSILTPM